MFCDLVDSTELASRLDPEDLRDVLADYQGLVAASTGRFGGFVAKYMGDGILTYFGWPQASENDAERAVHAGLYTIKALAEAKAHGAGFSVRISIATGLVVVGEEIGTGPAHEQVAIGQTLNLSARLQSVAAPNTLVIDQGTRTRIGELFHCTPLGEFLLKGFAYVVPAWRVFERGSVRNRFEALRSQTWIPLVGREDELRLLLRRWDQAKQGSGRVVLICGEPGIGKSRLAAELSREIRHDSHFRLRYACEPHFQNQALHPVIAHFADAAHFKADDSGTQRLHKLRRTLEFAHTSAEDIALIAELLSLHSRELPVMDFSPQRKRELTASAFHRRLAHLASLRPLLMLFEDAHWCDATTREFLDLTIDAAPDMRILLIVTYRPELQLTWIGKPNVSLITLSRLDRDQAAAMASHVAALPPGLLNRIAARSDGVPLFIEELAKSVLESGGQSSSSAIQNIVPATLQASLIARLDRLVDAKEIAQIGAAIGREFEYRLLAEVAAVPASALRENLKKLVAAGLIFLRGDPPSAVYSFKHALVRDAAYQSMVRSRRIQIHGEILRALRHLDQEILPNHPALLARHAEQAGLMADAARYFLRAGQLSTEGSATAEARALLMHGLDVAEKLPDSSERQLLQAELQVALSNVQMAVLGFGASVQGEVLTRALELCRDLPPTLPERSLLLSRTLYGEWSHKLHTGALKHANAIAREFVELGNESTDSGIQLMSVTTLATSLLLEGRLLESRDVFTGVVARPRNRACTESGGFGVDPATLFHSQFSRVLACLGLAQSAEEQMETALDRARLLRHWPSVAVSLSATCTTAWVLRDLETLGKRSAALMRLAEEQGFSFWLARGKCYAGWVAAQLGQLDEALNLLKEGIFALCSSDVTLYVAAAYAMLSDVHQLKGEFSAAGDVLEEAICLVARTGEYWCEAEILWRQGMLRMGNRAGAEAFLQRALATARRQCARTFEVRAALALARMWAADGKQSEARTLLAPLCHELSGRRETPDLTEARALLAAF